MSAFASLNSGGPEVHIADSALLERALTPFDFLLIAFSILLPVCLVDILFADWGSGVDTYLTLIDSYATGSVMIAVGVMWMIANLLFDVHRSSNSWVKGISFISPCFLMALGSIFLTQQYPQAPLITLLFSAPALLGVLRYSACGLVFQRDFYVSSGLLSMGVAAMNLLLWVLWITMDSWGGEQWWFGGRKDSLNAEFEPAYTFHNLNYETHCKPSTRLPSSSYASNDEALDVSSRCATVYLSAYIVWVAPLVVSMFFFIVGGFCLCQGWLLAESRQADHLENSVKVFTIFLTILATLMWIASSIAGASMGLSGTVMGFTGAAFFALGCWTYATFGVEKLKQTAKKSNLVKTMVMLLQSEWFMGFLVCLANFFAVIALFFDLIRQKIRKCRGMSSPSSGHLTPGMRRVVATGKHYHLGSVLSKACWLCLLYVIVWVGVAKITYVFLSWLNEELRSLPLLTVILIFYLIGLMMFLLPPVPGVPVYITGGILLASRTNCSDDSDYGCIGFWWGTFLAVVLGFLLKMNAIVMQQKLIGECLGKSVAVQKTVGVDKIGIRAIEMILREPGLSTPKIAILCGGPDWPTSVLTGILKLSVLKMLFGSLPIIVLIAPCALSGSFLLRENEEGIWGPLAGTTLAVAVLMQGVAMVLAAYHMQDIASKNYEALAQPRDDHKAVEELTKREQMAEYTKKMVTEWDVQPKKSRMLISMAAISTISASFVFGMISSQCFRPFTLTSQISASFADGGLEGQAVNLVKPLGWLAAGLFVFGFFLFWVWRKWAASATHRELIKMKALGLEPSHFNETISILRVMNKEFRVAFHKALLDVSSEDISKDAVVTIASARASEIVGITDPLSGAPVSPIRASVRHPSRDIEARPFTSDQPPKETEDAGPDSGLQYSKKESSLSADEYIA